MKPSARTKLVLLLLGGICTLALLAGCAGPPRRSVFGGADPAEDPHSPGAESSTENPSGDSPLPSPSGEGVVRSAEQYLGTPYRYGGASASGMDCSGLVLTVYAEHGVPMPRSCAAQAREGHSVARSELRAGDLVFFGQRGAPPSHVGIYAGSGRFIHASTGKGVVRRDALGGAWFADHYLGARRLLSAPASLASGSS